MSKLSRWLRAQRAKLRRPGGFEHLREVPRYRPRTVRLLGDDFRLNDGPSFFASHHEIFQQQIYRFEAAGPRPRVLDLGANCGVSVVYFKSLYPDAEIVAVEPDPQQHEILRWNVERRGFGHVTLRPEAVAATRGVATFHREGADAGRLHPLSEAQASFAVPTATIDDLLEAFPEPGPIDLLKIDIEGAETEALEACTRLDRVRQVFVEHHTFADAPSTLHRLLAVLDRAGFRYYLQTQYCPARPLVERSAHFGMDLQMNVFARREADGAAALPKAG